MPAKKVKLVDPADANAGRVLQHLMAVRNVSQVELARQTGIHQTTISRHIRGGRGWSASIMHAYANALGVDPAIFLQDSDEVLHRLDEALKFARELVTPGQTAYAA